ncbi:MAG: response regulator [Anaerolineae bacterium]|nr:response regulator [Anaerolineae bacterium]
MAEKILVVDDDIDSLKLIGLMLQRNGYEVSAASAGNQALSKASLEHPDLVILDVMMPDMSGLEVCRRLRQAPETKQIPIIMFTAKTLIDDKVAGFEAGADDYLTKPTHPAELASRVKTMLARGATQKPAPGTSKGITIGVVGAKGGVGTTSVALNIAAARLAAGENPIIVDYRMGIGSLGLSLGLAKSQGLASVLTHLPQEIQPRVIDNALATHTSGLRALLASARPDEALIQYSLDNEQAVLRALRSMSRLVVADLGSGMSASLMRLQREVDHLVVVVDPVPVTLNMARDLLRDLQPSRPEGSKTHVVVVNRAAATTPPAWNEVEQALGTEIRAIIALASELALHSLQAQVPMVLYQPSAIASTQLAKLAEELTVRVRATSQVPAVR